MYKDRNFKANNKSDLYSLDLHYNFVSYPKHWHYPYKLDDSELPCLPNHNIKKQGDFKNNGYIEYSINTKSKLTTDFRKNSQEEIYIEGSEIRGKVRSNLEILSFSYPEFIEDKKILYRGFTSKISKVKKEYSESLGLNKSNVSKINEVVKVGYLQWVGNRCFLCPAEDFGGKNFFTVDEYDLITKFKNLNLEENEKMYLWTDKELEEMRKYEEEVHRLNILIKKIRKDTGLSKNEEFNNRLKTVYIDGNWKNKRSSKEKIRLLEKALKGKVFTGEEEKYNKLRELYLKRTQTKLNIGELYSDLSKNSKFEPYEKDVTFSHDNDKGIIDIRNADGNPKGEILQKGVLYNSTKTRKKEDII